MPDPNLAFDQRDPFYRYPEFTHLSTGEPMNPILQAVLDQLKNVDIDIPALLNDPEFFPAAFALLKVVAKHATKKPV
jgi:hypothetical protein